MKKKKFFIIFCIIILDIFLIIGFLVIRDSISFNSLKNEVEELSKLDITKDRYNRKIKSTGDYAKVESAIKDYLDDYAVKIQHLSKMMNDNKLSTILSYDNYVADGPNFNNSLDYLEKSKKEYNEIINQLLVNLDDENINNYIYTKIKDPYYVSLYQELIFKTEMIDTLDNTRVLLEESKTKMNNIYDTCIETLNYLKLYQNKWKLEDGEIKFQDDDMLNYYSSLVSRVNEKKDE